MPKNTKAAPTLPSDSATNPVAATHSPVVTSIIVLPAVYLRAIERSKTFLTDQRRDVLSSTPNRRAPRLVQAEGVKSFAILVRGHAANSSLAAISGFWRTHRPSSEAPQDSKDSFALIPAARVAGDPKGTQGLSRLPQMALLIPRWKTPEIRSTWWSELGAPELAWVRRALR
jgi:hypothetical protein